MTAQDLILQYIKGTFIDKKEYKNIGHDFIKAIKPLNLPYQLSSGLYISTELILNYFDGDVDNLITWIKKDYSPSVCGSQLSTDICWNLYYWLRYLKEYEK